MNTIREEEEQTRPELLRRGFEFYRYVELPAYFCASDAHIHDAVEFIYMIEGSVVVKIDNEEEKLKAGDLVMFRSRGIHALQTEDSPKNLYYILKIHPKLIHHSFPKNLSGKIAFWLSVHNNELKHRWFKQELFETDIQAGLEGLIEANERKDEFSDIYMLSSVIKVLYGVLKSASIEFQKFPCFIDEIYKAVQYINHHYGDDLTAETIADKMNVSYSYFARVFKSATGKTFKEYLNITRINEAEILLINTDLSVTEISGRCGYNNVSHFISTYKRYKGKTPLADRKKIR